MKYRIKWTVLATGEIGCGAKAFADKAMVQKWAKDLNQKYPELVHTVEEVSDSEE